MNPYYSSALILFLVIIVIWLDSNDRYITKKIGEKYINLSPNIAGKDSITLQRAMRMSDNAGGINPPCNDCYQKQDCIKYPFDNLSSRPYANICTICRTGESTHGEYSNARTNGFPRTCRRNY